MKSCYTCQCLLHLGNNTIYSCHGVQQGDPLGPLGFALTLQPIAEYIKAKIPGLALNTGLGWSLKRHNQHHPVSRTGHWPEVWCPKYCSPSKPPFQKSRHYLLARKCNHQYQNTTIAVAQIEMKLGTHAYFIISMKNTFCFNNNK